MTTKNIALTPFALKRQALFARMTRWERELAQEFDKQLGRASHGEVMIYYDMGVRLVKAMAEEGKYGDSYVTQLAEYLNVNQTKLYDLANLAREMDRDTVRRESSEPRDDGRPLEISYFIAIMKIKSKPDQTKLFHRVRTECLSVNQLEREISASYERRNLPRGGGKPQIPTTPAACLQKAMQLGKRLVNYLPVLEESVFDVLPEMSRDEIDEKLLEHVDQTLQQFELTREVLKRSVERLRTIQVKLQSQARKSA